MIYVHDSNSTSFANNGLGTISPTSASATQVLNGDFEVELSHNYDHDGKWRRIQNGNILRIPVPVPVTPALKIGTSNTLRIYKTIARETELFQSIYNPYQTIITYYPRGTEVVYIREMKKDPTHITTYVEVITSDGLHGYMFGSRLSFVRNETKEDAEQTVLKQAQTRDQLFRIYRTVYDLKSVKAYAKHIFYDMSSNLLSNYWSISNPTPEALLQTISQNCISAHNFSFYTDLTERQRIDSLANKNPVEAIMSSGGFIETYGGEMLLDWYDVYILKRIGEDKSIVIREGKDLKGVTYDVNTSDTYTRVVPVCKDVYLPERYVDSEHIADYPLPMLYLLNVTSIDPDDESIPRDTVYDAMRRAVYDFYEAGNDLPLITMDVDFVALENTEEYKDYAALQRIFLGDTVRVEVPKLGLSVSMRMSKYTFNCLTNKYESITLGSSGVDFSKGLGGSN